MRVPIACMALLYIWLRRTVDWTRRPDEELLVPFLRQKVRLWNATFNLPYHVFRQRLVQIAELNHSRVEGATRAAWDEIPDGGLVLPVDDDDWFAPHVAHALARECESQPGLTAFLWDSRWIEVPWNFRHEAWVIRRRLFPSTPQPFICTTNNYAMTKHPESREALEDHVEASRAFQARLDRDDPSVKRLDARLSLTNRNLGSQTTLQQDRPTIKRWLLLQKFWRYRRLYRRHLRRLSPEFEWAEPYVRMMAELMQELKLKG